VTALKQPALLPVAPATPIARRERHSPRREGLHARTVHAKQLTRAVLAVDAELGIDIPRPQTRGDCFDDERPCIWVGCRYHLYLDVNPENGSIKLNFPHLEPWELKHTCALDFAEAPTGGEGHGATEVRFGRTLEEVALALNVTRERTRQLETKALQKLRFRELADFEKYFPHPQQGATP
jgi:hypothetical protein